MTRRRRDEQHFVDLVPALLAHPALSAGQRALLAQQLRHELEDQLDDILTRSTELPAMAIRSGPHVPLLVEARILYTRGYFYSCVAMCGIASEKILKDLIKRKFALRTRGKVVAVPDSVLAALERVEISTLIRILFSADALDRDARKAAQELTELRNKYAHGVGVDASTDALRAIRLLDGVVDGTVSLFREL